MSAPFVEVRVSTVAHVLALLSLLSLASCGTVSTEGASPWTVRRMASRMALGAEPPRRSVPYERLMNARGDVVDGDELQAWVRHEENIEAAYAEAERGDARAVKLVAYLERTFAGAGYWTAVRVTAPRCLVLSELQSDCHPDWTYLDFVGRGRGGARLKALAFEAYEQHLRELEKRNRLTLAAFNALTAGMVLPRPSGTTEENSKYAGPRSKSCMGSG